MANADDSGNSAPGNSTVSTRIPEPLDLGQTPLIRGCVTIDLLAGKLSGRKKAGYFSICYRNKMFVVNAHATESRQAVSTPNF
jgi:hypothetical protein